MTTSTPDSPETESVECSVVAELSEPQDEKDAAPAALLDNVPDAAYPEHSGTEGRVHGSAPILSRRSFLVNAATASVAMVGGIGLGFVAWGLPSVSARPAAQRAAAEQGSPTSPAVAHDAPSADALPQSYTLPIAFGQIGPNLIRAGAFDYDTFVQIHDQGGTPLSEAQRAILREGSDAEVVIDLANARFLLNLLWAAGLANNNPVLLRGALVANSQGQIEKYASTGGWTLATQPIHKLYSSSALTVLTTPQQARLEEAASAIYRPCCDNATSFPDCNHGMAMLGLLELMAAQDASVDDMLETAKMVNRFWFPGQTQELALYREAQSGLTFASIPAREAVSAQQFSSSGFAQVHAWLLANGKLEAPSGGGSNCGV